MAALRYVIEERTWFRIAHAAMLIGTNPVGVKKMMADGTLEWRQLWMNSKTLLVAEDDVLRVRHARQQWRKEGAFKPEPRKRAVPPTKVATRGGFDVFERTWDPSAGAARPLLYPPRDDAAD